MATKKITHHICMMMYGFGDSHEPNPETVRLVENILQSQLITILNEAMKRGDGVKMVRGEDLVFLLRHNKYKMQRFVRYVQHRDISSRMKNPNPSVIDLDPDKPRNSLLDFIESMDETGEFMDMSEIDETKVERMIRADRISRDLSEEKYLEFQKARCLSFKSCPSNFENIRHLVDPKEEIKFTQDALFVLCYFAFQTVAEMVDYALYVREDRQAGDDPLNHLPGSYYTATMFNAPHGLEKRRIDCTRIHTNQQPISVNEIKEVMRRVYSPQAGKLNFGGKLPATHYMLAL